jgi:hypothetical protein
VLGNNGDREVSLEWGQGKRLVEGALSETNPYAGRTSPRDSHSYDAPKVRFSATLGEEPEIEVAGEAVTQSCPVHGTKSNGHSQQPDLPHPHRIGRP